jgi:hypothetical protein
VLHPCESMNYSALIRMLPLLTFASVGCLTSTPPVNDASADEPQNTKGTGARDLTDATPGPSNPGTGSAGAPGSIGAGSGTGSGTPPGNAGPEQTPGPGPGSGPGPGPGTGH